MNPEVNAQREKLKDALVKINKHVAEYTWHDKSFGGGTTDAGHVVGLSATMKGLLPDGERLVVSSGTDVEGQPLEKYSLERTRAALPSTFIPSEQMLEVSSGLDVAMDAVRGSYAATIAANAEFAR